MQVNHKIVLQQRRHIDKWRIPSLYLIAFVVWTLALYIIAYYNQAEQNYQNLIVLVLFLGITGISITSKFNGNIRLVFYASCLFALGQLIQSVIYHKDGFESYQKSMEKFVAAIFICGIVLSGLVNWFLNNIAGKRIELFTKITTKKSQSKDEDKTKKSKTLFSISWLKIFQLLLCLGCIAIILIVRILGKGDNDAYLGITIGGFSIQLIEFVKPMMALIVAGFMHEPNLNDWILIKCLLFLLLISALCVGLCNEFGTAIIVFLSGVLIIWIFMDTKPSKGLFFVVLVLISIGTGFLWYGNRLYSSIPLVVSNETFAKQYTACCEKKRDLRNMLMDYQEYLRSQKKQDAAEELDPFQKETAEMDELLRREGIVTEDITFTYDWLIEFVDNSVQDKMVRTSYMSDSEVDVYKKDPFTEQSEKDTRKKLIAIMTQLANSTTFREFYVDKVLERKTYSFLSVAAYKDYVKDRGKIEKVKFILFEVYCKAINKIESKISGVMSPEEEAQGSAYHVNLIRNAMITGGLFGNGTQVNYGSEIFASDSDMVFGMAVAELGYVVGAILIILVLLIFNEMIMIGLSRNSMYLSATCLGIAFMWVIQSLLVIAGNCRLAPLSGVTLPLVASGGTSLLDSVFMIALVIFMGVNVTAERSLLVEERMSALKSTKQKVCKKNKSRKNNKVKQPKVMADYNNTPTVKECKTEAYNESVIDEREEFIKEFKRHKGE